MSTQQQLLNNINAPEIDFAGVATIINREPTLSYKLLRLANSALFGRRQPARSTQQALNLLGEIHLRKWLSIIVVMDLASDAPSEVMTNALMRARFCETLAALAGLGSRKAELFTLGLFSRLDTLFSRPLSELIDDLSLAEDIRNTLLEAVITPHLISQLWTLMLAYEAGEWDRACELMSQLSIEPATLKTAYANAISWAESVYRCS